MVCTFNPSTGEAEAETCTLIDSYRELQASQCNTVRTHSKIDR